MKKIRDFLNRIKENDLLLDTVNVLLGLVLIVTLILYFVLNSYPALLFAVWAAGFMNMVNGLKTMRKKNRATLGQSMLLMGAIILIGGSFLVFSLMRMNL